MEALLVLLGLGLLISVVGASDDDDVAAGADADPGAEETETVSLSGSSLSSEADIEDLFAGNFSLADVGNTPVQSAAVTLSQARLTDASAEDDFVLAEEFRATVEELLAEDVANGEITQEEADQELANILFLESPFAVSTDGGEDLLVTGTGADLVETGPGLDAVVGSAGNDVISLGSGPDIFLDLRNSDVEAGSFLVPADGVKPGNDTVDGGSGDDLIRDAYGSNLIEGRAGNDTLESVDFDDLSPDRVLGGPGDDRIVVDEGDEVNTGNGGDVVVLEIPSGAPEPGYTPVVINDFTSADTIEIVIGAEAEAQTPLLFAARDGSGSVITLGGVVIAELPGAVNVDADSVALFQQVPTTA